MEPHGILPGWIGGEHGSKAGPSGRIVQLYTEISPRMGGVYTSLRNFTAVLGSFNMDISRAPSEADASMRFRWMLGYKLILWYGSQSKARLRALLQASRGIILHGLFEVTSILVWRSFRSGWTPRYAIVLHGMLDPWVFTYHTLRKRIWMRLIGRRLMRHAAVVICASEGERAKLLPLYPGIAFVVCHWGIHDHFRPGTKVADRARIGSQFGLPAGKRIMLMIGRISHVKQFARTASLFLEGKLNADHHLLIVGIPEEDQETRRLDQVISLSTGSITLIPPQFDGDKYAIFNAADIFVNLSLKENFSYTTVESLSFGLPVVISKSVDIHSTLMPYRCARVVPVDVSPSDFCSAVRSLAQDPGKPRQAFLDSFTFDKFALRLTAIMDAHLPLRDGAVPPSDAKQDRPGVA